MHIMVNKKSISIQYAIANNCISKDPANILIDNRLHRVID